MSINGNRKCWGLRSLQTLERFGKVTGAVAALRGLYKIRHLGVEKGNNKKQRRNKKDLSSAFVDRPIHWNDRYWS